jgi:PKD domain
VPTSTSLLSQLAGLRPVATRRLALALGAVLAVYALALGAAPAGAEVSGSIGVQPRKAVPFSAASLRYHSGPILTSSVTYAVYWDPTGAYRSDWLKLIDGYLYDVGADAGKLSNVFSVDTQYTGPSSTRANYQSTFRGAHGDVTKYPTSGCAKGPICLTDVQIQTELKAFIEANHLPTGLGVIYFVMTPPNVNVCTDAGGTNCSQSTTPKGEDGFCSYHSAIEPASVAPIVYGVVPWVAGSAGRVKKQLPLETEAATADVLACQNRSFLVEANQPTEKSPYGDYETGDAEVIINQLSIQQQNITVNPLLNGWYQTPSNEEQGDVCQGGFTPAPETLPKAPETTRALPLTDETINGHSYYLQWAFNSTGVTSGKGITCWQGTELNPHFTHPNPVNIGDIVGFDANESSFTLDANVANLEFPAEEPFTAPIYTFDFGDGTVITSGSASAFHAYGSAGTYNAVLTITDSGGNVGTFSSPITVVGGGGSPGSAGPGAASATPGVTSPAGSGTGTKPTIPGPVATQAVVSKSLSKVARSGLIVSYSVNEQVAGQFQVLLAASVARRIGLHGAPATGLAAGTPPQIVIAKAILITTKGGRNTVKILFGKKTAAKLRKLHKVTLMVRLVVRNASHSPLSTTVLSTVNLSR